MEQHFTCIEDWRLLAFFVGLAVILCIGNYLLGLAVGKCSKEYMRPHQLENKPENQGGPDGEN